MAEQHNELATKKGLDQLKQELIVKIDVNAEKIDANTTSISRLTAQVIENHEDIGKMLTREEHKKDYNELLRGQDEMMVVLLRIDQERAATNARIDRVESDIQELKSR
ncbi:MAG TPA: hypothetical protein ENH11_02060 [Candidatus Acetothermia bacterium]|nr:hypothetical protein [Candidatus Acetothermia bacterium]